MYSDRKVFTFHFFIGTTWKHSCTLQSTTTTCCVRFEWWGKITWST